MSHPIRSSTRPRLAGALCAISALLASSFGAAAAPTRHAASGPVSGGTLRIGYTEDYVTFDPAEASGIDEGTAYATLYSGLYQLDKNNRPQLDLAAAPPVITNNAKVWTFTIHKGVLFSNGTELTANDIKYSMLRVLSPKLKPISYAQQDDNIFVGSDAYTKGKASDVSGIQVLNKYTIRFTLTNPLPLLPNILGQAYNMAVSQALVSNETQQQFANNPVGSGPFTLQSWQKGVQAVFVKNPHYYRAGQPYLDKLIFSLNISPSVLALKVQHGDLDGFGAGFEVGTADLQQMSSDPKYASYIVHNSPNVAIWLDLNAADPVMKSPYIRQAIAMAIDRTRLVQLDGGNASPLYQLYLPSYPQFDPTLANQAVYPYNVQAAIALVKQSGYQGQILTYMDRSGVPYFQAIAPGIQQDLQQIGLNVKINTVGRLPYHVVREQLTGHSMDPFDWGITYSDALDTYELNMSCAQAGDGGFSGSHFCDTHVDALAAQAMALPQGPAQNALWRQAQLRVLRSATKIPLMYPHNTDIFNTGKVGGFVYVPTEGPLYQYMWLK